MRMYDLIKKKRDGQPLEISEINWMIEGYTNGDIPDYQMSAFAMAVYYHGMTDEELAPWFIRVTKWICHALLICR